MRRPSITFLRATALNSRVRRVTPSAVQTARIVATDDGYELHATLQGSTERWVLTSPGGLVSTFGDLSGLRRFAAVVLGCDRVPISYQTRTA